MLPPPAPRAPRHSDDAVRETDDDAATSRLSAISLGYLTDPFASLLHKAKGIGGSATRKAPLINVGTHHRTCAIDAVVESFLATAGENAQIVSLGAGSDTRFWRLASRTPSIPISRYVEIDFPQLTATKAQRIARSPKLTAPLGPVSTSDSMGPPSRPYTVSLGGTALTAKKYALLPLDLRDVSSLNDHLAPLLDPSKPTLLVAECVFCYLPVQDSQNVIEWFGSTYAHSAAVLYEMCGLDDAFGKVMKRNLAQRNVSIPGSVFASPQAQADRFTATDLGSGAFTHSGAKSLWDIRTQVVPPAELARISKLEILDEIEELRLVLSHYCVAWASKGALEGIGL